MDGKQFDGLVRALSADDTRRGVLRRAAGGAIAAALAAIGAGKGATAAECLGRDASCRRDNQCCGGKCRNNGTCGPAGLGDTCNPNKPSDCKSGECGCINKDPASRCTCRSATCTAVGDEGCGSLKDCCDGFCVPSRNLCFPRIKRGTPSGTSAAPGNVPAP